MVQRKKKGEFNMSCLIRYNPAGSILLPQGYTRLAYIESTGTQWVNTGWKTTNKTEIYTEMYVDGNSCGTTVYPTLFGARNEFTYFKNSNSQSIIIRIWNGKGNYGYNFPFNCWNSIHKTPTQCWVNAQERTNYTLSSFTHTQPTYIFANNSNGSVEYQAAIRCKFFRIWDNGNIKRDFVPVQTTIAVTSADGTFCPSGSIGLLDLVENKFYQNKGTGTFIAGPECPQGFPTSEYCQVEWLGNEKATGYVAIPYTHKADTWVDTEMSFDSFYAWNTMFGACTADNSSDSFTFGCYTEERINCNLGAGYQTAFGMTADTFYRFLVSSKTIIKDTTTYSPNKTTTACDKTWALFTRHNNTSYTNEAGHGKFKYMKIYEGTFNSVSGSTLKAHLIPCYRRSDMKPGFYDLVGRSFHEFVGTGASLGPSITFGWGEVVNNVGATLYAIPHNISTAGKLSSPYDQSIYTEPDGSKWIRIFHHADPTTYKFASTNPFTTCFKTDDRRWWAIPVCNDVKGSWELMCKEKGTPSDTERKFRWIQNTNPMDGDFASTASSKITRNTSSGYMTNTYGGLYRFNNNCYIVANNGNNGNWFGAFGSWYAHDGGIPSFPGGATIKDGGYKDLYLRIPENQEQVFYLDSTGYIDAGQVGLESMFNTRQWTIAMWFNPSTLSSNAGSGANSNQLFVYRKEGDNNATHQLSIHLTKTKVGTSFWADDHLFTIPNYTANKWYHLTVTQNGATQTVYINGVSIGTASKGALALQSGSRMSFGYNPTRPSEAPKNSMERFRIYRFGTKSKIPQN